MVRRWWFTLYIFALITGAAVIIVPIIPIPKHTSPSPISIPVESVGFYSNSIPVEARLYISSWLSKNKVSDQSAENITPRQGSLLDDTYRIGSSLQRSVSITMDVKRPATSFTVLIAIDPADKVPPLTSITCVDSDPAAKAAKCKEMIRV